MTKAKPITQDIIDEAKKCFEFVNDELHWRRFRVENGRLFILGGRKGRAGTTDSKKMYRYVCVRKMRFFEHRIVYAMHYGELSADDHIDHIDGNGLNNCIENLRVATPSENMWNRKPRENTKTGFKGVTKSGRKWEASIKKHGEKFYLGLFCTPQDAARAYNKAAKKIHGEFARLNAID